MTKTNILKSLSLLALFSGCLALLLSIGPAIVVHAERADAKRLAFELVHRLERGGNLAGEPVRPKANWADLFLKSISDDYEHAHLLPLAGERSMESDHHFGEIQGYVLFNAKGQKLMVGGEPLSGGAQHLQFTGGIESAILTAEHSSRAWLTQGDRHLYRHFVPVVSGTEVTSVIVVEVRDKGIDQLVTSSVQTATAAAAGLVGFVFAIVLFILARSARKMQVAEQRATFLANFDPLTGMCNRRSLKAALDVFSDNERVCLFIADIDSFKQINDTHGHLAGDEIIKHVAGALSNHIGTPLIARWAGDEFVGLCNLPATDEERAQQFHAAQQAASAPVIVNGKSISCTLSIGSTIGPWSADGFNRLLHQADLALYSAKRDDAAGTYRAHDPIMDNEETRRRQIEKRLEPAFELCLFDVAFQPQYDAVARELRGFEALLRWHDPVLGHVSPACFIPVAEQTNQMLKIGDWVLHEACKRAAGWPVASQVSVNVSAIQISQPDFADKVRSVLAKTGLNPERLELELTETALLNQSADMLKQLNSLSGMGVGLALDDFGTGHSTLTYLASMPITKLKIDRSFVQNVGDEGANDAIINAVIGLAKSLRMSVIAEGVETVEQSNKITGMGCDNIQGYLYGRPSSDPFAANSSVQALLTRVEGTFSRLRA